MDTVKEIYDIIKELRDLAKKYKEVKMAEKVVEIQEKFFDLRDEMEALREENNALKQTVKDLQDASDIEKDLELTDKGYYIRKSEDEQGKKIMYCAACWQNHKKLMPYTHVAGGVVQCGNCHSTIQ